MTTGARTDPALGCLFEVALDGQSVGGFSEVSGLELATTTQDYAEGGVNDFVHKFAGPTKQTNIVLKRGVVDRALWDWYAALLIGTVTYRNGSVTVHDPAGEAVVMRVDFYRAFPVKWTGPSLDASQARVAVETLELCHQGLTWQAG